MIRPFALLLACLAAGCGPAPEPVFPANYTSTYTEVRNCRASGDHDLNNIRVLVDSAALGPYQGHTDPFPVGAVVLKAEHDFGDPTCSGPIKQWTAMRYLGKGKGPNTLDWRWQTVSAARKVVDEDVPRCIGCHTLCGKPPDGYEGTCTLP